MFNFIKLKKEKKIWIKAPLEGSVISLDQVPDKVFSEKMVGDGVAIKPTNEWVLSPVPGKIIQIFPTFHALGIQTEEGLEVLIHLGIETVSLKGKGFIPAVEKGQVVNSGDPLMKVDWKYIGENAESSISPIVITNGDMVKEMQIVQNGNVFSGQDLILVTLKKN